MVNENALMAINDFEDPAIIISDVWNYLLNYYKFALMQGHSRRIKVGEKGP